MEIFISIFSYIFEHFMIRRYYKKFNIFNEIQLIVSNFILNWFIFSRYDFNLYSIKLVIFFSLLIVIGFIDFYTFTIYNSMIKLGIVFWFITNSISDEKLMDNILGGMIGYLIFFIIEYLTKGIGDGDKDLALLSGLFLGVSKILLSIYISFIIGGIVSIIFIILKIKNRKDKIAYAPYLSSGCIVSTLFGDVLLNEYIKYLI
ncbi:MAG: prepilin peptidase [Clostridium sp.]|nr:prepilin peptidase [Clostridium sp.]